MTDSPGTTYTRSYGSRSRVRLVASTVTSGQPAMIRSTQARTPSRTCSQLSITSSASLPASEATSARSTDVVRCSGTPTVSATAAVTIAGSVTWTRSTNHTPSRRAGGEFGRDAQRQPGLADATRAGRGHQAVLGERRGQRRPLAGPTDERRDRHAAARAGRT